jgi:hypothetical protein
MLVFLLTALLTALIAACRTASSGTRATPTTVSGARLTASGVNIAKLSTITVTAHDYSFAMPTTIPAGLTVVKLVNFGFVMPANLRNGDLVKVVNQGTQAHEITIVQLAPGKTVQDILAWAKKPSATSPFLFEGGMAPIAPGSTGWLRLSLNPGRYVMVCNVIDPTTGKRHALLGMIYPFTVQA